MSFAEKRKAWRSEPVVVRLDPKHAHAPTIHPANQICPECGKKERYILRPFKKCGHLQGCDTCITRDELLQGKCKNCLKE